MRWQKQKLGKMRITYFAANEVFIASQASRFHECYNGRRLCFRGKNGKESRRSIFAHSRGPPTGPLSRNESRKLGHRIKGRAVATAYSFPRSLFFLFSFFFFCHGRELLMNYICNYSRTSSPGLVRSRAHILGGSLGDDVERGLGVTEKRRC